LRRQELGRGGGQVIEAAVRREYDKLP